MEEQTKEDFLESFISQIKEFREYVLRISTQYKQLRFLKDSLSDDQLIVQMDFAENYSCHSLDEIQSAYWNQTTVTFHPTVIYYKHGQEFLHKSVIFVSDEERHNAALVYTFIKELISHIRNTFEKDITCIHYWTDSPTSQYRNKTIFNIISLHKQLFQTSATWSFFEAGHGKGPCDGLGGASKRMAGDAVKHGKTTIQDATDYFKWTANQSETSTVRYIFVAKEKYDVSQEDLAIYTKGLLTL